VSQCYGNAITNRELKEDAKGRIRLALHVLPGGRAEDVRVVETTLNSKAVEDCVVKLVQSWTLPSPDRPLDFLYTYELSNL
jgi:outer membrane biosynthesis protein TonB